MFVGARNDKGSREVQQILHPCQQCSLLGQEYLNRGEFLANPMPFFLTITFPRNELALPRMQHSLHWGAPPQRLPRPLRKPTSCRAQPSKCTLGARRAEGWNERGAGLSPMPEGNWAGGARGSPETAALFAHHEVKDASGNESCHYPRAWLSQGWVDPWLVRF